jgi:3-isopropylmalate/(R)-2-methylmalate dehydratase large subunit
MNIIEKILAKASGVNHVSPGEIVEASIDRAMVNEITGHLTIRFFHEVGAIKVFDREKVVLIIDHTVPAAHVEAAEVHKIMRNFANDQGIKYFYDIGRGGVCHQIMIEKGLVKPGDVVVGADSHTCSYGAVGAFATGIGSTEMTSVFITGKLWFKIPKVIKVNVNGNLQEYVTPKDIFLCLAKKLGVNGATYRGLEYSGSTIRNMSIDGRVTMCNMAIEVGGKTGIVEPDEKTITFMKERTQEKFSLIKSDEDSVYEKTIEINANSLSPLVACPDAVDNVKPASELQGLKVDQIFIGSCTNGRIEDLRLAARFLKGKRVSERTRLIIIPASQQVYLDSLREGLVETFVLAGAIVSNPTCGACYGGHIGVLASGEVCLSTTNRNFVGRMGSNASKVYLASPATAAVSALKGCITDPTTFEEK